MARAHAQSGWEHQHRMLKPALASHGRGVAAFWEIWRYSSGIKEHDVSRFFWGPAKATVEELTNSRLEDLSSPPLPRAICIPRYAAACRNPDISLSRIPFREFRREWKNPFSLSVLLPAGILTYAWLRICTTGDE